MKKNNKFKFVKTFFSKIILPFFVFFLFLWILFLGLKSFLNNDAYFRIKKINFIGLDDRALANKISHQLLYENIFDLNIKKAREDINILYPQFYYSQVIRNFPDELTIKIIQRRPLAQIKQAGFFLIDSDGVIVSDISRKPFEEFIIISGLKGVSDLSFGKKINTSELKAALILGISLNNIKRKLISYMPQVSSNKNISIELSKYPSLYVYFDDLELRFYKDYLDKELNMLNDILTSLDKKINQVRYIDLRFDNPAISFRK